MARNGSRDRQQRRPQSATFTTTIIVASPRTAQMVTRSESASVVGQVGAQRPAAPASRPCPARSLTNTDQMQPPPPPPKHPGAWDSATMITGAAQGGGLSAERSRDYQTQEIVPQDDRKTQPLQYSEQPPRESQHNDPHAYGSDNRDKRDKTSKADRNAVERGAHKIKKRFKEELSEPKESRRDLAADLDRAYDDLDREQQRADKYKHIKHQLEDEVAHYQVQISKLHAALVDEQERVERTKRSANQMQSTMDNREFFLGAQAHDDEIRATFSKLMNDIKTWSTRFSGGNGDSFKEEMFPEYQRIAPLYTEPRHLDNITMNKKQKRLFVRGWTAYVMSKSLFRTLDSVGDLGTDVWLDPALADNFLRLENELWFANRSVVPYKSFNDWRAFTAELLGKATSAQNKKPAEKTREAVKQAVSDVMGVVRPWHKTGAAEELNSDENELCRIFTDAVQFAQFLRRQRALWSIRFPSRPSLPRMAETGPLMFDPTCMKDDRLDDEEMSLEALKKCYVELVVTPALYKRGTMNGELFENEEAATPAIVIMGSN